MSTVASAFGSGRGLAGGTDAGPGGTAAPDVAVPYREPWATVVSEHGAFDALTDAWDDLWRRTPTATAFQTHAWNSAWAHAYVPAGRLAVVTVWDGDSLVAAAPLYRLVADRFRFSLRSAAR